MKFQLALDEKGLTRDDLPKSQQLKIKEIEKLKTQIEHIDLEGVDESFEDEFENIKVQFDQADEEVVVFIRNFDVEKSRKQRERLAEMRDRKKKLSGKSEPVFEKAPEPVSVPEPSEIPEPEPEPELVPEPIPSAPLKAQENLEALKEEAQVYPEQFEEEFEQEEEAEEVEVEEEFEKVGNSKPRKFNVPLVIMGVGALLLTWGAVNFFKNKE
jgi:hypothetical protein